MLLDAHDVVRDAPTTCAYCAKPFPLVNDHIECWRSSDGRFYCSEFCADDAEEKAFCAHRRVS